MNRRRILASLGGGWKNPYVTDGLIAMWDGEWNAGGGVHDPNATVWKDLVNGRELNLISGMSFSDKFLKVVGLANYNISVGIVDSWNENLPFTLKIVACCPNDYTISDKGFNVSAIGGNIQIGRGANTYCYMGIFRNLKATAYNVSRVSRYDTTVANSYAYVRSASDFVPYFGTVPSVKTKFYESSWSGVSSTEFKLGNDGKNAEYNLFSAMVWDRELTQEELEAVYAIDKARFGLP